MRFGFWEIVLVLVIVLLLLGPKRLRIIGADLSVSIKNFGRAMRESRQAGAGKTSDIQDDVRQGRIIEGEVIRENSEDDPLRRRPKV